MSGDSEGNIIFWNHKECKINRIIKEAHEGSIFSILFVSNQQNTASGSASSFNSISKFKLFNQEKIINYCIP